MSRRAGALVIAVAVLATLTQLVSPRQAFAAGTLLFQNAFNNRTVDGTGSVTKPTRAGGGSNFACLTAKGNTATPPLLSCSGSIDNQGSGKLRLTDAGTGQVGAVFADTSFPTSSGLDVTFNSYQWGGTGADGVGFMLGAIDPANPAPPASVGGAGGTLGYAASSTSDGLANAYLGVGLDVYGNFSASDIAGGTGCTYPPYIGSTTPGAVVVRGPGNGRVGYCGLQTTYNGTTSSKVTLHGSTRAGALVPVQVLINPTVTAYTSTSGVSVSPGTYKVVVTPIGQTARTLTGTLPSVSAGLYPSTSWLNANGVPKQLAFGFFGSTGASTDVHEISDVKVLSFAPVPQLSVSTTSYAAATSQPGDPVTYRVSASVQTVAEPSPVSVTQTVPVGVTLVGAYGSGWVCQPPSGQTVTCTTSSAGFPAGTTLPVIIVVGIVTTAGVTAATVQSGSPSGASSADADPGTDTTAAGGNRPAAPSGLALSPAVGSVSGGGTVTITGSNITGATAIEIGTTAEQQAGTPITLFPCSGPAAPGCFTVSGQTLVISSMPARASPTTVGVTVVTDGIASAVNYVYADRPATPAAPTATAGVTSATVSWSAPATNGSPITGYVVARYLDGTLQGTTTYDASTTTRTLTGLTAGGSYTFTVAAVNAFGTSAASPASPAVVPYAVPAAPVITAATAASLSATLTWTTPDNHGRPITGYVVTPYIGTTAQPSQTFTGTETTRTITGLAAGTTYTFTVAAQNLAGTGPPSVASPAVTPNRSPSLTFPAPPPGEVGVPYSRQLTVTDGTAPYTWSVSSGSLPPGLTLNSSSGLLSGTPTTAGTYSFTVQVVDASGLAATRAVTLTIAPQPSITFSPADGEVGVAYSRQPALSGGTAPFTWSVSSGALPGGLSISTSTGLISGTPTASGSFPVTVSATDAFGQTANRAVTLVIVPRPAFTATTPPSGQVGVAYSHALAVTGGAQPLTWSLSAGSLPPGLSLNPSTGQLSGTPTTVGTYPFTVTVTDANGQTATKQVSLVIAPGPIVITKSANVSSAVPGSTVAYTITVANTGTNAFPVSLDDPLDGVLDDATYPGNATASGGTLSYSAQTLHWNGTVAAGTTVTIGYSVTVTNPAAGNKVLANTVTSPTLGTNCAASSTDGRCTATVTVPGLTIVKTADAATVTPGGTVHFTIVATNTGQTPYPDATLTDGLAGVLDDASYGSDASATSGTVAYNNSALTWTGALAPGASATITYSVTANSPPTGDRSITGTVASPTPGSTCPGSNPAAACTATVAVRVPALSINNSVNTSTASPGDTVTFTVTLANTGQTAYDNAQVAVSLTDALDDASYNGDATATAGSVSFSLGALRWTGDLAIGATAVITASMTVRSPAQGDHALSSVASSSAAGSTCPAGAPRPACTASVQIQIPALTVTTAADVATTTPGSVVHYTVTVANTGQTPYTGATANATLGGILDDATYGSDVAATRGSASVTGTALHWTGDLPVGATATITYSVTVKDPPTGNRSMATTVSSPATGSTCPPGSPGPGCTSTVAVLLPGLAVAMTAADNTTTPGSVVQYTVSVENTGQTSYQGLGVTIDLAAALDDAEYNYDASFSTGSLTTNPDGTLTWTGSLAPGAFATGTLSMKVGAPATGDRQLGAVVVADAAGSNCRTGSADSACRPVVTVLIPGLTITKTASTTTTGPGGTVGYTILVRNDGETTHPAANVTDDLTRVLTDSTYDANAAATSGSLSYVDSTVRWTGALAPGATATITYSVTVRDPDPGDKTMTNTAVSTTAGNNCPAGGSDPRCTAVVHVLVPGLTLTQSASVATTTPGATFGVTVTATNTGATPLSGATFDLDLSGALDDAVVAGTGAGTGSVAVQGDTLTWTGNLAIGASVTVNVSFTVRAADTGDDRVTSVAISDVHGDNNCADGSTDSRCTTSVPVARLVVEQHFSQPTATPGSVLTLSATFVNTGQVPYNGITGSTSRADTSDDAYPVGDQTASSGTLSLTSTAIVWTGSIPVGGTVVLSGSLVVKNPPTGNKNLTTTLVSTAPGSNCPAGGADPRCTAHTTVLEPGLTISTSASTTGAAPGGTVGYTVTIDNTGETSYPAAAATISLAGVADKATYNGDATATAGTVQPAGQNLAWTGPVAVGEQVVITYSITVAADAASGDKTLVTSVSSTDAGSTCPPSSGNEACRSIVVILTPGLTITKSASTAHATLGSSVLHTVRVTNTGQTSYSAAEFDEPLADVLDDATYAGDAAATAGSVDVADGAVHWSGPLVPGATATVTYTVNVTLVASGDGDMHSTVTSGTAGANCATGSTDSRCTTAVPVVNTVSLTFDKDADVASVTPGGEVNYTLTVANATDTGITGVQFVDDLADVLDDAEYNGDATADIGTVSLVADSLEWTGILSPGTTATIRYSVTAHEAPTGDGRLAGTVSSPTRPQSNNCTSGSADPRCTSVVTVASLAIEQSYETTAATPGSVVRLTATFANTGTTPYEGITVTSPLAGALDDATPNGDQAASSGTIVMSSAAITWTGDIPVGGVVTVTGTVTVQDTPGGDQELTGTLVTGAPGSNCPPGSEDPRCTATLTVLEPGLMITKTADTPFTRPGGTVHYTITIANTGEAAYPGATVVSSLAGALDDADYNADATASTGNVSYSAPDLTWTGALAPGATATLTYSVTAQRPATGDKVMVDTVRSDDAGSNCPTGNADPACRATVAVLTPALTIVASAGASTAQPGGTTTFTITATNSGQITYAPATLEAGLGDVLDDADLNGGATASTGTVGIAGETLTWHGNLAPGASATITYSVTVGRPEEGDHRLSQTVMSTDDGSICPSGGTDPRCSATVPVADLRIDNTADTTTARPTSVVGTTVTLTNDGDVPYTGITVTVDLGGSVDDAAYNGDAAASDGTLRLVPETAQVVWTGDVPAGGSVVITGSVTVGNPPQGDADLTTLVTTDAAGSTCPASDPASGCATSVPVLTPGLSITKAADTATTTPGSTVAYTITIANTGETAYTGATVTDTLTSVLDDAEYDGDAQATTGQADVTGQTLTWTGDLAIGDVAVVSYSVLVRDDNSGDRALRNTVRSAELGSSCPDGSTDPGCRSLVSVLTPALDIAVTADLTTATPGSTVTYTVTIDNTGQTGYTAATVTTSLTGVLDDAAYDGGASATAGTVDYAEPELTWTGDLAPGESAIVTYSVTVADPDAGDRDLTTSVTSPEAGSSCGDGPQCTSSVPVLLPGLAITAAASRATVTPGDEVTFTLTITNTGETPYTGAVADTSLDDVLDDADLTGEVTATRGEAAYAAGSVSWTGDLPVDTAALVRFTVTVADPDPGDKSLSATVVSAEAGSTCPAGGSDPDCTATVAVLVPALDIAKSASSPTVAPGGTVDYTIVVANTGETPYTGAAVDDPLAGVLANADYPGDATVDGGGTLTLDESGDGPVLRWTGDLPVGASAVITYTVTAHETITGDRLLVNTATSSTRGSTCPPDDAPDPCTATVRVLEPGLTLTKSADTSAAVAGDRVRYTVTVENNGEVPYVPATFADPLADVLDDGAYGDDAVATTGTVSYADTTLTWSGALDAGETATVTYTVVTSEPATGDRVLVNSVHSASQAANCATGTETGCTSSVPVLVPALTIVKAADATLVLAGKRVHYTVTATNDGEAPFTAAGLTDSLRGVLDDARYDRDATASRGQLSYSDGKLRWTGGLPVGASVVISYSVTATGGGDGVLANHVTSGSRGAACPVGDTDPRCTTSTPVAGGPDTGSPGSSGTEPPSSRDDGSPGGSPDGSPGGSSDSSSGGSSGGNPDGSTITLTDLTQAFRLTGMPGSTVTANEAVTMFVTTDDPGGYVVTVRGTSPSLTADRGNAATIPIGRLLVRESGTGRFRPLSANTPVVVHRRTGPSWPSGDPVGNDYRVDIPYLPADSYATTLEYVVSTQ